MTEVWLDIPGYEGLYQASSAGEIRSSYATGKLGSNNLLKGSRIGPYLYVNLCKNGIVSRYAVHRAILLTFVGPCPDRCEGAHLDGDALNNASSNLVWATRKENMAHMILHGRTTKGDRHWLRKFPERKPFGEKNPSAKLTLEQVRTIKSSFTGLRGECAALSRAMNVPYSTIRNIVTGHRWKHVGV